MSTMAIVQTGGKQYLVKENDELIVQRLEGKENDTIELPTLATFDEKGTKLTLGTPVLPQKAKATILSNLKGDKVRIAKFKAKVRYRKVIGFRPALTKIKILSI